MNPVETEDQHAFLWSGASEQRASASSPGRMNKSLLDATKYGVRLPGRSDSVFSDAAPSSGTIKGRENSLLTDATRSQLSVESPGLVHAFGGPSSSCSASQISSSFLTAGRQGREAKAGAGTDVHSGAATPTAGRYGRYSEAAAYPEAAMPPTTRDMRYSDGAISSSYAVHDKAETTPGASISSRRYSQFMRDQEAAVPSAGRLVRDPEAVLRKALHLRESYHQLQQGQSVLRHAMSVEVQELRLQLHDAHRRLADSASSQLVSHLEGKRQLEQNQAQLELAWNGHQMGQTVQRLCIQRVLKRFIHHLDSYFLLAVLCAWRLQVRVARQEDIAHDSHVQHAVAMHQMNCQNRRERKDAVSAIVTRQCNARDRAALHSCMSLWQIAVEQQQQDLHFQSHNALSMEMWRQRARCQAAASGHQRAGQWRRMLALRCWGRWVGCSTAGQQGRFVAHRRGTRQRYVSSIETALVRCAHFGLGHGIGIVPALFSSWRSRTCSRRSRIWSSSFFNEGLLKRQERRTVTAKSLWAWHSLWGQAASLFMAVQASCEVLQGVVFATWQSAMAVIGRRKDRSSAAHLMIHTRSHAQSKIALTQCILAWRYWVVDYQGHVHHFAVMRLSRCVAAWRRYADQGVLNRRYELVEDGAMRLVRAQAEICKAHVSRLLTAEHEAKALWLRMRCWATWRLEVVERTKVPMTSPTRIARQNMPTRSLSQSHDRSVSPTSKRIINARQALLAMS
eukprot:gnl/MRDRNA2_/MRDRNA2_57222_c0_seq1.p1 gnl/MRDRNA2_/MRDRNA2_57222_c0~~gnl/MRDRNA2_/MRDRNA2_57222_c0_seq1.p1  ORF type:complete len:735 (-),score=103.94 gnl/MRDRNA2_/MRDRNA2_57222_c0_seq1:58-2262(-)